MGQQYNHLTLKERYQIEALSEQGFSNNEIGQRLGRNKRTIERELARLPEQAYQAELAHEMYLGNIHQAAKANKRSETLQQQIQHGLEMDMSPEQIAGRLHLEEAGCAASMQTIYRFIAALGWRDKLPRKGKVYRHRKGAEAGVKLIPNRVDIDQRPAVVDEKQEIGHWEGDTVYGQDGYFVTLVERVSKLFLTVRVKDKSKKTVSLAVRRLLKPYKVLCNTITFDNGGEFADHERIAKTLKCQVYFAKPYHSWQRGLNENTNGLLRRYCPKGMKASLLTDKQIQNFQNIINIRPRKALNYLSPIEFLMGKRATLMLEI